MTLAPSREAAGQAALAQRLNDPAVSAALVSLLDHADLLAVLVQGLDGFVARSEVIGDSLISSFGDLRSVVAGNEALAAVDVGQLVGAASKLASSELLSPEALDQVSVLARGLAKAGDRYATQPVEIGGLLSLGRLLKDPDIKRAISYFATVAKAVGQELNAPTTNSVSR